MKQEQVPVRNGNDTVFADEVNHETLQNHSLRREEHVKYRKIYIIKILPCSGRKPTSY